MREMDKKIELKLEFRQNNNMNIKPSLNLSAIKELDKRIESSFNETRYNLTKLKYYNPSFSTVLSPRSNILGISLGTNKTKNINKGDESNTNLNN